MFVLPFLFLPLSPSCFSDAGLRGIGGFDVRSRRLEGRGDCYVNGIIDYWLFRYIEISSFVDYINLRIER